MFEQILHFITPQFNPVDPLQVGFSAMILFGLAYAIWGVRQHANAQSWERIWHTGPSAGKGNLDVEHGSVNDLSNAVATRHERLAEIMPGMLLILGLLGTFLGLGMALDKASTILASAGDGGATAETMNNMMAMMHGLGSKFKTSTWGILAFLILRTYSSINAYEERRLGWCVSKMKTEVDRQREDARALGAADNVRLVGAIDSMSAALLHGATASAQAEQRRHDELATATALRHQEMQAVLAQQLEHGQVTRSALEEFVGSVGQNIGAMADAALQMEQAAKGNAESTKDLRAAIGDFRQTVAEVLKDMKHDLNTTISAMSEDFKSNMRLMSGDLAAATGHISSAIAELSGNVGATMASVEKTTEKSLATHVKAQEMFIQTSMGLNVSISEIGKMVANLGDDISAGLEAVSSTGQEMKQVAHTLVVVSKKLAESMEPVASMTVAVNSLLEQMKASLGVSPTMSEIRKTADMLGADISSGLHAVSLTGQEMARAAHLFQAVPVKIDQSAEAMTSMTDALNVLVEQMRSDSHGSV